MRYGNTSLIAEKLKRSLKNLKLKKKLDHDRIIELHDQVTNSVNRLKAVKAEHALTADPEFRSAVFRLLPPMQQSNWTLMDRTGYASNWEAFYAYLKQAYVQATRAREEYAAMEDGPGAVGPEKLRCFRCDELGHTTKTCPRKPTKPSVQANSVSVEKKPTFKEAELAAGKCPVCNGSHTDNRRFPQKSSTMKWPADQLSSCPTFRQMDVEERGLKV